MENETYKRIKEDFGFIFFVIVATNLSLSIYNQTINKITLTWQDYAALTINNSVTVLIAMSIMLYLFKGFLNGNWNLLKW